MASLTKLLKAQFSLHHFFRVMLCFFDLELGSKYFGVVNCTEYDMKLRGNIIFIVILSVLS